MSMVRRTGDGRQGGKEGRTEGEVRTGLLRGGLGLLGDGLGLLGSGLGVLC